MPKTLLAADEPAPVSVYNPAGASPFLLVADHAGNMMPRALGRLGVAPAQCERHIAWDIGIAGLGRLLADALDAMLIRQNYSRLVIDCHARQGDTLRHSPTFCCAKAARNLASSGHCRYLPVTGGDSHRHRGNVTPWLPSGACSHGKTDHRHRHQGAAAEGDAV